VLVEGRLQMRDWTTPQGQKVARLELRGEMVHFLERRPDGAPPAGGTQPEPAAKGKPHRHPEAEELF